MFLLQQFLIENLQALEDYPHLQASVLPDAMLLHVKSLEEDQSHTRSILFQVRIYFIEFSYKIMVLQSSVYILGSASADMILSIDSTIFGETNEGNAQI